MDLHHIMDGIFHLVEAVVGDGVHQLGEFSAQSVPVAKPSDPELRIKTMRRIKSKPGEYARLYAVKDIDQFVRQARYMADFEDDFQQVMPFEAADVITYADLSQKQLRTYFTWRTQCRRGVWQTTSLAYAFLYVFELLNNICELEPAPPSEVARRLAELWLQLRGSHSKLDARMTVWFKDYYLCNEFGCSFGELLRRHGLERFYPALAPEAQFRGYPMDLLPISGYDYKRSRFFAEEPELLPVIEA